MTPLEKSVDFYRVNSVISVAEQAISARQIMKRTVILLAFGILLILNASLFAETRETKKSIFKANEFVQKPQGFLKYLIDPARFEMTQSYSLSFTSIGGRGYNQGLYLNTMNYRFSNPLLMQVRVGYLHQPLGGNQILSDQNGKLFLQRAMLQYKSTENTTLMLDYQSYPSTMMSPYYWER
jgi:hypothetical protein